MATAFMTNPLVLQTAVTASAGFAAAAQETELGGLLPDGVRTWLARLRLLEGVPFAHLVPDSELLPPESIRFFYLDRDWTDALVQGALSVGTVTTLDREQLQALHARLREEVDAEERRVRMVGGEEVDHEPAGPVSGFLLRSRAVSGWPALHVRAYREEVGKDFEPVPESDPRRLRLLRLERLAPAVLLCLFDGIPEVVRIEEPRQGIQFGVDLQPGADDATGATIPLRDVLTAGRLDRKTPRPPGPLQATVPFRRGAPGVLHLAELNRRIALQPATRTGDFEGPGVGSAEFAMQMLQFPFRQVFGDQTKGGGEPPGTILDFELLFRPTVAITVLRAWDSEGPA
jgi:hypothetical protein